MLSLTSTELRFHDVPVGTEDLEILTIINQCSGKGDLHFTVAPSGVVVAHFAVESVADVLSPGQSKHVPPRFPPAS